MKLTVRHTLTFSIGTPARAVEHLLLAPVSTPQQKVERWSIEMPNFAEAATFRDGFGNRAHLVSQVKPEDEMVVTVSGAVEMVDKAGVLGRLEYDPVPAMFRRPTPLTPADPALLEGLDIKAGRIALLHELMGRLHTWHEGATGQTQGSEGQAQSQTGGMASTPTELTHAFLGVARGLEIPARYVTGYLFHEGVASFHAWAEAWDEGLGWIGFDPSLDVCPATDHIRVASGLDSVGAAPIRTVPVWDEMPVETVEIAAV